MLEIVPKLLLTQNSRKLPQISVNLSKFLNYIRLLLTLGRVLENREQYLFSFILNESRLLRYSRLLTVYWEAQIVSNLPPRKHSGRTLLAGRFFRMAAVSICQRADFNNWQFLSVQRWVSSVEVSGKLTDLLYSRASFCARATTRLRNLRARSN